MRLLRVPHQMNHPHSLANRKSKAQSKELQRMPTRPPDAIVHMAEHFQNPLLQYTLY